MENSLLSRLVYRYQLILLIERLARLKYVYSARACKHLVNLTLLVKRLDGADIVPFVRRVRVLIQCR